MVPRQTASLFYDQIKLNGYDDDKPALFHNFSHCFLNTQAPPQTENMKNAQYRSIDGSENNLNDKLLGASFTSFGRLLKAQYEDNIHSIRTSSRGYELPSPRNIVRKIFLNDEVHLNKFKNRTRIPNNLALMFGQYVANDVASRHQAQYIAGGPGGFQLKLQKDVEDLKILICRHSMLLKLQSKQTSFFSDAFVMPAHNRVAK